MSTEVMKIQGVMENIGKFPKPGDPHFNLLPQTTPFTHFHGETITHEYIVSSMLVKFGRPRVLWQGIQAVSGVEIKGSYPEAKKSVTTDNAIENYQDFLKRGSTNVPIPADKKLLEFFVRKFDEVGLLTFSQIQRNVSLEISNSDAKSIQLPMKTKIQKRIALLLGLQLFYSKKTHLDHLVHILRAVSRVGDIGGYTAPPVTYVLDPKDTARDIGVPLARVIRDTSIPANELQAILVLLKAGKAPSISQRNSGQYKAAELMLALWLEMAYKDYAPTSKRQMWNSGFLSRFSESEHKAYFEYVKAMAEAGNKFCVVDAVVAVNIVGVHVRTVRQLYNYHKNHLLSTSIALLEAGFAPDTIFTPAVLIKAGLVRDIADDWTCAGADKEDEDEGDEENDDNVYNIGPENGLERDELDAIDLDFVVCF